MKEPKLTKESLAEVFETMKKGFNKIPLAMSPKMYENFNKLKPEEQKELLDLYESVSR